VQFSYLVALTLLSLMKPNVAGVAILGGVVLLLIATTHRRRLILLTLGACIAAVAILTANHVSISAMLSSYHEASKYRGGLSAFGFLQMTKVERIMSVLALCSLAVPGLWLIPRLREQFRAKEIRSAALSLFFPLALLVSIYAVMTNGDLWLVECPPVLALVAFISFSQKLPPAGIRRFVASMLCAGIAVSLFMGAVRLRVYMIGPEQFFEWSNNENFIRDGFLKDMRVGAPMMDMERQIRSAISSNPGPFLLGPRIDFNYAVLHLPSPGGMPAWWHPGVSFGMDQEPHLIDVWKGHHFQTLVFLKNDYTSYPPALLDEIRQDYIRDDRYRLITVYHRRPGTV
jgi:hypothetical protein